MDTDHTDPSGHQGRSTGSRTGRRERTHKAGAFDIRVFIGALLGLYGLILLATALLGTSQAELDRAAGVNINLWAGLGLVAAAVAFVAWARLRPVEVPEDPEAAPDGSDVTEGSGGEAGADGRASRSG